MAANINLAASSSAEWSLRRLADLAELDDEEMRSLLDAGSTRRMIAANREIFASAYSVAEPSIMLSGWAAGVSYFGDGRRQLLDFLLPGDLIAPSNEKSASTARRVVTLTDVTLCTAPLARADRGGEGLAQAYATIRALKETYLFRHIVRLGRLSAQERMTDWLLEMFDRLGAVGLVCDGAFPLPLTQEALADTLGLTSVHVNRTLQNMRREGMVEIRRGEAKLPDPERLRLLVGI